jgi:hypothetical protein
MHRVQLETAVGEPFRQGGNGAIVVIVEMGARREQFDRPEPMGGDVNQVVARQP